MRIVAQSYLFKNIQHNKPNAVLKIIYLFIAYGI